MGWRDAAELLKGRPHTKRQGGVRGGRPLCHGPQMVEEVFTKAVHPWGGWGGCEELEQVGLGEGG